MKVTVIGTGYVGLVTGTCLAEWGHDVTCLDLDAAKIARLQCGEVPIYEHGLQQLLMRNQQAGRLRFTTDVAASVEHGDIQFIAVGTPPDEDGSADLRHVLEAARQIGHHMDSFKVIVNKSTAPIGTTERVRAVLEEELAHRDVRCGLAVVSNPEFLKEGSAVVDFLQPDRVVIGCGSRAEDRRAREWMIELYAPLESASSRLLWDVIIILIIIK